MKIPAPPGSVPTHPREIPVHVPASEPADTPVGPQDPPRDLPRRLHSLFRIAWLVFILLLTTIPYLVNWRNTPAGRHYTWILPPYPEDSLAYQAWAQQAARGSLIFHDKYTALPHSAFLFHPFFLVAGWLGAASGSEIGPIFLLLKTAGTIAFFLAFYRYLDWLQLDRLASAAATILAGVSSGFGGILILTGLAPRWPLPMLDVSRPPPFTNALPDINTFWSLLWNPLFPFSLLLLLLALFWLDRGTRNAARADLLKAGLATGILALIHPYSQMVVLAMAVIFLTARRPRASIGLAWRFAVAWAPFAIYVASISLLNPVVSRHNLQGEMRSPPLASYLYAFGLPLLLAAVGAVLDRHALARRCWPLLLWFALSLLLAFFPVWFQRKLVFGSHLPLCILAGVSFAAVANKFSSREARAAWCILGLLLFLPLSAVTTGCLLFSERLQASQNTDGAFYVPNELMEGFKVLKSRSRPSDIVCATAETSRLIPAFAGNTVLWGHWAMSIDSAERENWFSTLFGPGADWNDPSRAARFWDSGIRYIFAEGALQKDIALRPACWRPILQGTGIVFSNQLVTIYQRNP